MSINKHGRALPESVDAVSAFRKFRLLAAILKLGHGHQRDK